jgi:regulator of sigma D
MINQIREWLHPRKDLLDNLRNLSANRNDLNHAGMNRSPMSATKFTEKLKGYISIFKDEVTRDR